MALDFSKTTVAPAATSVAAGSVPGTKDELMVVEQYDIVADRAQMNEQLVN